MFTDRHGKDAKMCVLLLTTAIYIICYSFAASAVIFYFVYVPLFLGKAGLYLSHRNGAFETNVIARRIISIRSFRKDVLVLHSDNAISIIIVIYNWKDSQERSLLVTFELSYLWHCVALYGKLCY